jgi:hypothetical protein
MVMGHIGNGDGDQEAGPQCKGEAGGEVGHLEAEGSGTLGQ